MGGVSTQNEFQTFLSVPAPHFVAWAGGRLGLPSFSFFAFSFAAFSRWRLRLRITGGAFKANPSPIPASFSILDCLRLLSDRRGKPPEENLSRNPESPKPLFPVDEDTKNKHTTIELYTRKALVPFKRKRRIRGGGVFIFFPSN